jgi:Glycosyl transferases group 1
MCRACHHSCWDLDIGLGLCRLQLEAFRRARDLLTQQQGAREVTLRMTFVGGCRNDGDRLRLSDLMALAETLRLSSCTEFHPNASVDVMHSVLARSVAGLHSMQDEHFGISVVDYMAAGCIPIAHASGALFVLCLRPESWTQDQQHHVPFVRSLTCARPQALLLCTNSLLSTDVASWGR